MAIHPQCFYVSIKNREERDQIESAFQKAGYKWYRSDSPVVALRGGLVAILSDGDVCGNYECPGSPMPFPEGLALLESLAEPVTPATFKVGDRVRIVRKAIDSGMVWTDEMTKSLSLCGKVVDNDCVPKKYVRVKTTAGKWAYLPESLELIEEPEAKPEPETTSTIPEGSITGSVSSALDWVTYKPLDRAAFDIHYGPFTTCDNPLSVSLKDDSISSKETSMSETKTPETTIERRIALATGRILWRAAWPVRKLFRGVAKGAVNMFYAALFGGVCYGGYELVQFLQAIKITLPE